MRGEKRCAVVKRARKNKASVRQHDPERDRGACRGTSTVGRRKESERHPVPGGEGSQREEGGEKEGATRGKGREGRGDERKRARREGRRVAGLDAPTRRARKRGIRNRVGEAGAGR